MRKTVIKVYLSKEQLQLLDRACSVVGEDRSRFIAMIILDYLKDTNLIREAVHGGKNIPHHP